MCQMTNDEHFFGVLCFKKTRFMFLTEGCTCTICIATNNFFTLLASAMAVSDCRGVMIANGDGHVARASSRSAGGKLPEGGWQPKDQAVVKIYTFKFTVVKRIGFFLDVFNTYCIHIDVLQYVF